MISRQITLERIQTHLNQADDVLLESLLILLDRAQPSIKPLEDDTLSLDAWDKQIIADCQSGQFDDLITAILQDHQQGKTTKLSNGLKAIE